MIADHPMIDLRHLHRWFGSTRAVDDVSFEVHRGEVFGYIGPNGAGKTTTMRILATLDLPTCGDAMVDGFSVVDDPDRVRRRLGFMPDSFGTYANVNCREYLDFFARAYGLYGRQRRRALSYVMGFTDLEGLSEKPISSLSKGMKQRLCIARAMIHDPSVLILDEPAAGLDPRARIELRAMIRELATHGKTVLVSSHILTELAEMCDRVGIIEQGKLLVVGTVEEMQQARITHREIRVRVLGDTGPLLRWLGHRDDIEPVATDGQLLRFSHTGEEADQAALLRDLVMAGFTITEFAGHQQSLEDVFMRVTRGVVQ
ncbi:MAG: ATP-binding cassette domain-containing protein [Pirellulaceae bacterium]